MSIADYFPKPLEDNCWGYFQVFYSCLPAVSFLRLEEELQAYKIYKKVVDDPKIDPFTKANATIARFEQIEQHAKCQFIAGVLAIAMGVALVALGLFAEAFWCFTCSVLHFYLSSYDDIKPLLNNAANLKANYHTLTGRNWDTDFPRKA
jgi:hypothetical protein